MNTDRFFNLLGAIVGVALVTTIVIHPESKRVISASGSAFQNILATAITGNK